MKDGLYQQEPKLDGKPRLHQSLAAVLMNKSPRHCWHKAFGPKEEEYDEAKTRGQIAHSMLLGGADIVVVEADSWRTNAAKDQRQQAIEAGKLPILTAKMDDVQELLNATLEQLEEHGIELTGKSELTALWASPGGVLCQGRIDHFIQKKVSGLIYDFKFVNSASMKTCVNSFIEYGYDIQYAAYKEAVETILPELAGRTETVYIFTETEPPFAMRVMPLAGSMRTTGEWRWGLAKEKWQHCLNTYGTEKPWPSFEDDGTPVECPAWFTAQQVEREQVRQEEEYRAETV